ncbi:MAG: cob(I)yrinic acid a,c-diamide adenosyltransferase [Bacteroidia bacterium]|jgi:cob(I)alamin adenosyltransferase|nr:cob(I)yrinic acid a,c-diamide adenosyltransferase [Bacteroidia bacterium]
MTFKIYTKTGDKGETSLIGGSRVLKSHIRIESYGTIDELNSYLGLIKDQLNNKEKEAFIYEIQDRLFTIGSVLASDPEKSIMKVPDLFPEDITTLEKEIDKMNENLPELKSFVLPGGNILASHCHIARCICRRAERMVVLLQSSSTVPNIVVTYLNRLSDYLFVLSRELVFESKGIESPWRPRI